MKHLIILSDLHINSSVAISLEEVPLDDGGLYKSSRAQHWLSSKFSEFYKYIFDLEGEKIIVINGDIIDLNKHSKYQLISPNASIAVEHAVALLKRSVATIANKLYIVRGTEAHVGNVGEYEEMVGRRLGSVQDENGNYTHWSLLLDVDGVIFDMAHHGVIGQRAWTKTHPLDSLAANTIIEATRNNAVMPDVIIRSHLHTHADTGDNYPIRVIQTPAWMLNNAYSYRIGSGLPDIGGLVFHCDNGEYTLTKKLYKPESRKPIVV